MAGLRRDERPLLRLKPMTANLGLEIRRHREARGRSLGWVARGMKARGHHVWSTFAVSRVERGLRTLTLDEAVDLVALVVDDAALAASASGVVLWLLECEPEDWT